MADVVLPVLNEAAALPWVLGRMPDGFRPPGRARPPGRHGESRLSDVGHVFASPRRAERELGFHATVTFEEGMRAFARAPLRTPVPA